MPAEVVAPVHPLGVGLRWLLVQQPESVAPRTEHPAVAPEALAADNEIVASDLVAGVSVAAGVSAASEADALDAERDDGRTSVWNPPQPAEGVGVGAVSEPHTAPFSRSISWHHLME